MVRTKLPLQFIEDDRRRKATFTKRLMGIKKKATELSRLCAIPVLLICYTDASGGGTKHVETWPENDADIHHIVRQYSIVSQEDRDRRKLDLKSYVKQQIKKMLSRHDRLRGENVTGHQLFQYGVVPKGATTWEIIQTLDVKLAAVDDRIALLNAQECMKVEDNRSSWHEDHNQLQYLFHNQGNEDLDSIMDKETRASCTNTTLVPLESIAPLDQIMPEPNWSCMGCHNSMLGSASYGYEGNNPTGFYNGGFDPMNAGVNPAGVMTTLSDCFDKNCNNCGISRNDTFVDGVGSGGHYPHLQPWQPQTSTPAYLGFNRLENVYNFTGLRIQRWI